MGEEKDEWNGDDRPEPEEERSPISAVKGKAEHIAADALAPTADKTHQVHKTTDRTLHWIEPHY